MWTERRPSLHLRQTWRAQRCPGPKETFPAAAGTRPAEGSLAGDRPARACSDGRRRIAVHRRGVAAPGRAANLRGHMKRLALSAAVAATLAFVPGFAAEKPKITSQDQLPRFSYDFKGKVTEVTTQEAAYQQLAILRPRCASWKRPESFPGFCPGL